MRIATWNVNGIRARLEQVQGWLERDRPDLVCLQEIKASPDQVPTMLGELGSYWCYWHGHKGYSGVALLARRGSFAECPTFEHPAFDHENRVVTARLGDLLVASVYVPNGGKDFPAKMRFLDAMVAYAREVREKGLELALCGDLNVARTDQDVHPRERKVCIGQLPEERARIEGMLEQGLVDLGRTFDPDNAELFTWWAPWRNMRQRNIGWRLDYVLASESLRRRATRCVVQADVGTSDHAPVLADFEDRD